MSKNRFLGICAVIMGLAFFASLCAADDATDPLVQDFNNAEIGIAFTMLSEGSWENPGRQLFHTDPATPQKSVQAVTLSNASKKIMPYQGDTRYGLVFSMTEKAGFYKYFATKSQFATPCAAGQATMVSPPSAPPANQYVSVTNWAVACGDQQIAFCGRCFDGGVCAGSGNKPNTPSGLWPALGEQVPFAEFQKAKNKIVAASGSASTCTWASAPNIWNEFDTNGLSPTALAGVLFDKTSGSNWTPSEKILCAYLKNADPSRTSWPVYTLSFTQSTSTPSQLTLTKTLSCPVTRR